MSDIERDLEKIALMIEQSEFQEEILIGLIELSYSILSAELGMEEADEIMYDIMSNPEIVVDHESVH